MSEQERSRWEQQREEQIKAENLNARQRAADPAQRSKIDPATGRTWGDAVGRGMYDQQRRQDFRDMNQRNRETRERLRWRQIRERGRQGAN